MNKIFNIVDRLSTYGGICGGVISVVLCFSICIEVVRRYFFNSPMIGSDELNTFMVIVLFFLGLAYTNLVRGNVRVEIFISRAPQIVQAIFNLVGSFFALLLGILLVWGSWRMFADAVPKNLVSHSLLHIPMAPVYLILVIGAGLLCLQLVVQICRQAMSMRTNASDMQQAPPKIHEEF